MKPSTSKRSLHLKTSSSIPSLDLGLVRTTKSYSKAPTSDNNRKSDLLEKIIFERAEKKYHLKLPSSEGIPSLTALSGFNTTRANNLGLSHKKSDARPVGYVHRTRLNSEDFHQYENEIMQVGSTSSLEGQVFFKKGSATLPDEEAFKPSASHVAFTPLSAYQFLGKSQLTTMTMPKSVVIGKRTSRENLIDSLYTSTKEIKEEIGAILSKQFDEELRKHIETRNIRGFSGVQKERILKLISILEKNFKNKDAQTDHDVIKLVYTELHRIRKIYDEFLLVQMKSSFSSPVKAKTTIIGEKEKHGGPISVWKAFGLLIQHSSLYQDLIPTISESKDFELSQIHQAIISFKNDYKYQKDFDREALKAFGYIQGHIQSLNKLVDSTKEKVESIMNQYNSLLESYKDLDGKNSGITSDIMKMIQEVKGGRKIHKQGKEDDEEGALPVYQQKYLEYLVDDYRETNKKLTEDIEMYKEKLAQEKKNSEEAERLRKKIREANSCDKGVMTHILPENNFKPLNINLTSYLEHQSLHNSGIPLTDKMTNTIINMLYSDKMAADLCDESDKRPRKSLRSYLPQWFLKRFGIYSFSETILQNLMYTLSSRKQLNKKFDLFENMLGMQESHGQQDFNILEGRGSTNLIVDREKIRLTCYNTAEMNHCFLQLLSRIRKATVAPKNTTVKPTTPTLSPTTPRQQTNENNVYYKSLLGISQSTNIDDLVDLDYALELIGIVAKEQKFTMTETKNLEAQFTTMQEQDMYIKVMNGTDRLKIEDSNMVVQKPSVDINLFLKLVLDAVVNSHMSAIETSFTMMRANIPTRNEVDISLEDYCQAINRVLPMTSQAWKEQSYTRLMNEAGGHRIPLSQLMPDFVSNYFHEDEVKDSSQKEHSQEKSLKVKAKKEGSEEPDSGGSRKGDVNSKRPSQSVTSTEGKLSNILENQEKKKKPVKNLSKYREFYMIGSGSLNEKAYEGYDVLSSVVLLQEIYELLRSSIASHEKGYEDLRSANEELLVEFYEAFGNIDKELRPELLGAYKKKELVCFVEYLWSLIRVIIVCIYRSSKSF